MTSSAKLLDISVSSVFSRLKDIRFPKLRFLPKILSIVEFKGNSDGKKFHAILTDAHNHQRFDILPSRTQTAVMQYLLSFPNKKQVHYLISDMNQVYRDMTLQAFPNDTIVIDKFNVMRYVTWALENVRKRVQNLIYPSKRKYFKRSRRLLLTHKEKLNQQGVDTLELILLQSHDLAVAYHLKESFYDFMRSKNRNKASKKLKIFILSTQVSGLKEFIACLTMLGNWSKYILNAFDCPYTNGYTEGINNAIKVIKRNAFDYRNFDNFRNRIFLALSRPRLSLPSSHYCT